MLYPLIFLTLLSSTIMVSSSLEGSSSCAVRPLKEGASTKDTFRELEDFPNNKSCQTPYFKDIHKLQNDAFQKTDEVLKDKDFQDFVAIAKSRTQEGGTKMISPFEENSFSKNLPGLNFRTEASCYIFVSFSLGAKALLNFAEDAKRWGAILVLRGFKEGSYTKTAKALQKIILKTGQGILIDPELFTLFAVTAVPTFVLSKPIPFFAAERMQTPIHDRLQGHVSVHYALEAFAKEGDLKEDAKALLERGGAK